MIERRYIRSDQGQLHLRTAGKAGDLPTLVMLHQVPNSGQVFAPVMPLLADRRRVIAIDMPGFGMSDPVPDPQTIERYAEVIGKALRDSAGEQIDIVGYHTGAAVAAVLANAGIVSVRRVAMIAVPVLTDAERAHFAALPPIPFDEAGEWARAEWQRSWTWRGPGQSIDDLLRSFAEKMRPNARRVGAAAIASFDMGVALRAVRQPLLIARPRDDLWEATARAEALRPDAVRVAIPEYGHGLWAAAPQKMAAILQDFFDRA